MFNPFVSYYSNPWSDFYEIFIFSDFVVDASYTKNENLDSHCAHGSIDLVWGFVKIFFVQFIPNGLVYMSTWLFKFFLQKSWNVALNPMSKNQELKLWSVINSICIYGTWITPVVLCWQNGFGLRASSPQASVAGPSLPLYRMAGSSAQLPPPQRYMNAQHYTQPPSVCTFSYSPFLLKECAKLTSLFYIVNKIPGFLFQQLYLQ